MSKNVSLLSRFKVDSGGVVTEEFLVVLPMILGAFVIAFEFGRALWAFNVMTSDVDAGLRYLVRTPAAASNIAAAKSLAQTGSPTGTANHAPWNWVGAGPTIDVATQSVSSGFNQNMTIVTMSATLPLSFPFLDYIKMVTGSPVTLTYNLRVSDQAACISDPLGVNPCGAN